MTQSNKLRFTHASVAALRAPTAVPQIVYWDATTPKLGICVSRNGTKAWFLQYRIGKKQRKHGLGRFPTVTLAEAREKAGEAEKDIQAGVDPTNRKKAWRENYESLLFPAILAAFIEDYAKPQTRRWKETERLLRAAFLPIWEHTSIDHITRADIQQTLKPIAKRSPSTANATLAAIRKLLNWTVEQGHLQLSPCAGIKKPSVLKSRDRVLTDDELGRIWHGAQVIGYPYGQFIRLLMLTAQRRSEVAAMRWADLDLHKREWTIPAQANKSGRLHVVPLSNAACDVIEELPRLEADYVFPARGRNAEISGFSKWKAQLDQVSGVKDWRQHDLRRTVATNLARGKAPRDVIARVLNHTQGGVLAVYDRYDYLDEKKLALDNWSDQLRRICNTATCGTHK